MAILTLKEAFEGEMTETNVDVGIIDVEKRVFRVLTPTEVKDYLTV
jgi:20S proteasome subunit alpha 2